MEVVGGRERDTFIFRTSVHNICRAVAHFKSICYFLCVFTTSLVSDCAEGVREVLNQGLRLDTRAYDVCEVPSICRHSSHYHGPRVGSLRIVLLDGHFSLNFPLRCDQLVPHQAYGEG